MKPSFTCASCLVWGGKTTNGVRQYLRAGAGANGCELAPNVHGIKNGLVSPLRAVELDYNWVHILDDAWFYLEAYLSPRGHRGVCVNIM